MYMYSLFNLITPRNRQFLYTLVIYIMAFDIHVVTLITVITIHSKYFADSDWLKAHV